MTDETSLTRRRGALTAESRLLSRVYRVEFIAAAVLVVVGAALFFARGHTIALWVGAALAAMGAGHYYKIHQNRDEEQALQAGAQGETRTTRSLADGLDNTHYLFNDIVIRHGFKSAQIDHLVIGRTGIFAVETKNWRGVIQGQADDSYWWQTKFVDAPPIRLKSPVIQARRHASVVTMMLKAAGLDWPDVVPIVAFASMKTELRVTSAEVPVVHLPSLPALITARRPARAYTERDVDQVVDLVMRKV